jgi:uncharacterized protein (TIGR01777 family)
LGVSQWIKPSEATMSNFDVVINLAGEPIDQRWTATKKESFYKSRVGVAEDIVSKIAAIPEAERPKIFLNGTGVGYYGDAGDQILNEESHHGQDFLADLCVAWEKSAQGAERLGVRTILFRTGVVLGKEGRAFQKMLRIFRLGIGGRLGNGKQWMPWIHVDDLRAAMLFCIENDELSGAVNGTAPQPERNSALTKKLAQAVGRWEFLPVPSFALTLMFGEFGGFLLSSQRAMPTKLIEAGFRFQYPSLDEAFRNLSS